MVLARERLQEIVAELASRPGHEKVRALTFELLMHGLGASSRDVDFERPVPGVRGRIDALLGQTVFEFKRDLRRERGDAEEELTRYLTDREHQTGLRFIGIATDGADFAPYELRRGQLTRLPGFGTRDAGADVLALLDAAVAVRAALVPTPELIRRELGRESVAFARAHGALEAMWSEVRERPDVELRRRLWADLLSRVYGASVDADDLFFQHSYLTIVAKTMATQVLGVGMPGAADLLAGRPFADAGIHGAVESDFFDWVLDAPGGAELVERIARQVARFALRDVQADVLKGLYESLIDPEQRHDLGEYYTPDWLAARMCERAITDPLHQRVLDPACGSGTFLFHAVRGFLAAAEAAGMPNADAISRCCATVLGIDVHPVAAIIARVTYLLALGEQRLRERPAITVPGNRLRPAMLASTASSSPARSPGQMALARPCQVRQPAESSVEVLVSMHAEVGIRSMPLGTDALSAAGRSRHPDALSTLARGLHVLEYVAANEGAAPKEIAAGLGLPISTAYHLVNTLIDEGYLVRLGASGLVIGEGVAALVERIDHRPDPFPELHPLLGELADRCGDVAVLGRLVGRQTVIMSVRAAAGAEHGDHLRAGLRGPSHTMALGKVLLASLDPSIAVAVLRGRPLESLTDRTVTGADDFFAELETARTRGIALDVEEGEEGLCCVAARIRVPADRPAAAVAVAVSPDRLRSGPERLMSLVATTARRSSALLFGTHGTSDHGPIPTI